MPVEAPVLKGIEEEMAGKDCQGKRGKSFPEPAQPAMDSGSG
jgi:hypothetical protein